MFNIRRNDERDKMATTNEVSQPVSQPAPVEPEVVMAPAVQEAETVQAGGAVAKPGGNNLKPSIISEGFEFIGEIRSSGYLTIDGTVRGTLSLHSIQIGVTGVLDGNVTCDTMNVKGNFSGSLDCRDLTIGSRAVVDGKVSFKSITIQRGGVVKGELKKKP